MSLRWLGWKFTNTLTIEPCFCTCILNGSRHKWHMRDANLWWRPAEFWVISPILRRVCNRLNRHTRSLDGEKCHMHGWYLFISRKIHYHRDAKPFLFFPVRKIIYMILHVYMVGIPCPLFAGGYERNLNSAMMKRRFPIRHKGRFERPLPNGTSSDLATSNKLWDSNQSTIGI